MEVLSVTKPTVYPQKTQRTETKNQQFEQMWKNSISGEEFVRRAHEHINEIYAARDKQ